MENIIIPANLEPVRTWKDVSLDAPILWFRAFLTKDHELVTCTDPFVPGGKYISKSDYHDIQPYCMKIQDILPRESTLYVVELVPLPGVLKYTAPYLEQVKQLNHEQYVFTSRSMLLLKQFQKLMPEAKCLPIYQPVEPTESFFAKAKKNISNRIKSLPTWKMNHGYIVFETN